MNPETICKLVSDGKIKEILDIIEELEAKNKELFDDWNAIRFQVNFKAFTIRTLCKFIDTHLPSKSRPIDEVAALLSANYPQDLEPPKDST